LLQIFWRLINPTDDQGQYVDKGFVYTSAIYYQDEAEKDAAEISKYELQESGKY
jgi:peptide methionine sulfoxide reductase msrA/msrB